MLEIDELLLWKQTKPERFVSVNPVLCCLVDGICDEDCVLSKLSGTTHILQDIWNIVTRYWKGVINYGSDFVIDIEDDDLYGDNKPYGEDVFFYRQLCSDWKFPEPNNICINMMPFYMERTFEKCMLPDYLKPYWYTLIDKLHCEGRHWQKLIPDDQIGKIGFLTIHESCVEDNEPQRRGGVHTESPGMVILRSDFDGKYYDDDDSTDFAGRTVGEGHSTIMAVGWGMGVRTETELLGGIYMASNLSNSCEVWNCKIPPDENGDEIIGSLGDVEHLRELLPKGEKMKANQMYWLTDRTPHESLPLPPGTYRQFFRLVTSEVSVWFEEHSTKNPLGVVPDPKITKIVKGPKFIATR